MSPTRFNLFMDTLGQEIRKKPVETKESILMFADDVQLRAGSAEVLQTLLDVCTSWAARNKMTWSTVKYRVLGPEKDVLMLAGDILQHTKEVEYLGVSLSEDGITDTKLHSRITQANKRVHQLYIIGMDCREFSVMTNHRMYHAFIRTMIDYDLHLTAVDKDTAAWYAKLERAMVLAIAGIRGGQLKWWRKVLGLMPLQKGERRSATEPGKR